MQILIEEGARLLPWRWRQAQRSVTPSRAVMMEEVVAAISSHLRSRPRWVAFFLHVREVAWMVAQSGRPDGDDVLTGGEGGFGGVVEPEGHHVEVVQLLVVGEDPR